MVKFEQPIHKFGATHLEERVGMAMVDQLRRVYSAGATYHVGLEGNWLVTTWEACGQLQKNFAHDIFWALPLPMQALVLPAV